MLPRVYETPVQLTQCHTCRQVSGCIPTAVGPSCRTCLTKSVGLHAAAEAFA
jgi:hypothetical protein